MTEQQPDGAALHRAYVDAINSNVAERVTALLSDDVVFQVAGEPELVGTDAVREWVVSFFEAFDAFYSKRQLAFEVSGDIAFDRYTYSARLVGREDGALLVENGKGVGIFRRSADGRWLLIIDSWSPFASAAPVFSIQSEGESHGIPHAQACSCRVPHPPLRYDAGVVSDRVWCACRLCQSGIGVFDL